jgi:rubrerythrin
MSNSNDKKFSPRFAKTPDELVFYSDTDQSDYPIYLTPSFEVKIKKRPEDVERYATFHLKTVEVKSFYDGKDYLYRGLPPLLGGRSGNKVKDLNDYVRAYPQLPLQTIFNVVADLKCTVYVREMQLNYEVYKGDYEEPVAEAPATVLAVILEPPYADKFESQRFAITYSTLKRLLSKLPPDVATAVQRIAYVDKKVGSRSGAWPFIKIKFCLPSPELSNAFNEVKKWLEGVEEVQDQALEAEEGEVEAQAPVQIQVPEVKVKPKELEVELETPAVPTAAQPQPQVQVAVPPKPSLVKVYLLSMRLPSKYLVQKVEVQKIPEGLREVRKWEGEVAEVASRLETIRKNCYTKASRVFAYVEGFGTWIAVSDEAVDEARKISEYVKAELSNLRLDQVKNISLSAYAVEAIPVYLEPEDAKKLLNAAIAHLSADVDELESKIAEAEKEQKKEALKRLESSLKYKQELLNAFKRFLQTLT